LLLCVCVDAVQLQTVSTGLSSRVVIQGVNSRAFLCFSSKGKLVVKVRLSLRHSSLWD